MNMHWVFEGCNEEEKKSMQAYWAKKWPRLERLLIHYCPDLREIRLTVYHHPQSESHAVFYEVRAVLHLPTGTLVAQERGGDGKAALDKVADKMAEEIKRHKELLRHDYVFKRKRRERENLSAAGLLLGQDRQKGRQKDFFELLRPMLRTLRDYARHELKILEIEGTLHRGEVTVDDLIDEVVKRAWERFDERPKKVRLDLWLTDLMNDTLEEWIKQEPRPHASLMDSGEERMPEDVPQVDDQEWWATLLGYDDSVTLEDVVPDRTTPSIWDELEAGEQRDRIRSLIRELPTRQRQTFLMHALENFTTDEIAMMQDRPESEVKQDIQQAREFLKRRLEQEEHDYAGTLTGSKHS